MGTHNANFLPNVPDEMQVHREYREKCILVMILQMGMGRAQAERYIDCKLRWMDASQLYLQLTTPADV